MENPTIKVQMFGGFSISFEDKVVLNDEVRHKKEMSLLKIFLSNRKKCFTKNELIEILYKDSEIKDPVNALKVIIHRLRKMLIEAGLPGKEWIIFDKGRYCWNNIIPCEIDSENFEEILSEASKKDYPLEKRIELYKKAAELYKGDFLASSEIEDWIIFSSIRYQNLYINCIKTLYNLLSYLNEYEALLNILEKAINVLKYSEEIHIYYVKCLIKLKRFNEAREYFTTVTNLFFNELGMNVTQGFRELYLEISNEMAEKEYNIEDVVKILKQNDEPNAYYCNLLSFIENCKILLRATVRSKTNAHIISFTIMETQGAAKDEKEIIKYMKVLREIIGKNLRMGDIYTQVGQNRILIMILGAKLGNCYAIVERIKKEFHKMYKGKGLKIEGKILPARDFESIL
ncbi:hypothetical protein ATZ99_15320 [Thermovenabulum gondwanense]|uniref:OmpR/PhoB-type domain-containing protein n=2 Tax=Thermovenabulum gondwanense TaxID=520767 RepID=A0A162MEP0_9FIRM|nr:hypothetical protein ATZ99_15320 [Thermovenabulum gondwanense]